MNIIDIPVETQQQKETMMNDIIPSFRLRYRKTGITDATNVTTITFSKTSFR